jgi:hypothetical protein
MTMMILTGASVLGRDFFREISEARSDAFACPQPCCGQAGWLSE